MHPATSAADRFDAKRAVATIDRAAGYDGPLRRRTEGVTWMLWGVVSGFLPSAYVATMGVGGWSWTGQAAFSLAWPVLGLATVAAVWRIASLSERALAFRPARLAAIIFAFALAVFVLIEILWFVAGRHGIGWPIFLTFLLVPWGLLSVAQWTRLSAEGRRLTFAVGAAMLLAGSLYLAATRANGFESTVNFHAFALIAGGVPLATGTWHAFRNPRTEHVGPIASSGTVAVASTGEFDVQEAVETIGRATAFDLPLRKRTEAVTWMAWGLASALVGFLTLTIPEEAVPGSGATLFAFWTGLGLLVTSAAWRIAGLTEPQLAPRTAPSVLTFVAGFFLLGGTLMLLLWNAPDSSSAAATAFSVVLWSLLTALQWSRMTAEGRRSMVLVAIAMVATGSALVLLESSNRLGSAASSMSEGILVVAGGIPFVAGAWRALRT